jgi:uncharacterized protein (DUF1697 family)
VRRVTHRYVAFLRGIAPANPLMRNTELRAVFNGLGYGEVSTVLSSGNVLFESPQRSSTTLENAIERALADHLGNPCATFVRARPRMHRLVDLGIFDGLDDTGSLRCMVTFLKTTPEEMPDLPHEDEGSTALALHDATLFSVMDTTGPPTLLRWWERAYGTANTTRSWRTVRRVMAALDR